MECLKRLDFKETPFRLFLVFLCNQLEKGLKCLIKPENKRKKEKKETV